MEKVSIGVIGIGNMGSANAQNIAKGMVPGMELAAVADLREERRVWAKENLPDNIRIYRTAEELLEDSGITAVYIATPHYEHPRLSILAMQKGLHVLCEKPAGVYTKQVREMNEESKKHNLVFAMMFNQRTNPVYRKMHALITSGIYGQIKRVNWIVTDWYRTQSYYDSGDWRATWDGEGGGVLLNQCPHQLDLLQWICGLPSSVQAFCHEGKWHHIEVEDDVTAYLEYPNGATGVFITSTGDAPGTNRFEVDLEKAQIICDGCSLKVYELEVNEREHCFQSKEGFAKPKGAWVDIPIEGENTQHMGVFRAFASAILKGEPLIAEGVEGIRGLTLSNAMHLSSWLGKAVKLPIDEDQFLLELNQRRAKSQKKSSVKEVTFDTKGSYGCN